MPRVALTVVTVAVAGVAAMVGRNHIRRGVPAAPANTIRSVRADLTAVQTAFKEGKHA